MFSSSPALANIFFKKVSQISPPKDYEKSERKILVFRGYAIKERVRTSICQHVTSLLSWNGWKTKSFCQLIICELENKSWGPIKNHLVNMFILGMLSLKNNHYYQTFFMIISPSYCHHYSIIITLSVCWLWECFPHPLHHHWSDPCLHFFAVWS